MKFTHEEHRIYALDETGHLIAEVTFPVYDEVADIDHTFVDDSLRGQGIAAKLMEETVSQIRKKGWKARLTCPYAVKWFTMHPEHSDLLD